MAKILEIPNFITLQDINTAEMLREIAKEKPANAFVIVWPKDDGLPTYHSNTSDMPTVLLRLQTFIHEYFQRAYEHNQ